LGCFSVQDLEIRGAVQRPVSRRVFQRPQSSEFCQSVRRAERVRHGRPLEPQGTQPVRMRVCHSGRSCRQSGHRIGRRSSDSIGVQADVLGRAGCDPCGSFDVVKFDSESKRPGRGAAVQVGFHQACAAGPSFRPLPDLVAFERLQETPSGSRSPECAQFFCRFSRRGSGSRVSLVGKLGSIQCEIGRAGKGPQLWISQPAIGATRI